MKLDKGKRILIVGLGLIGGSYARALKNKGYYVSAIDSNEGSVIYAKEHGVIDAGYSYPDADAVGSADIVVFALYPKVFRSWISENQHMLRSGSVITDVTGVKTEIVYDIQAQLRPDVEFIPAHPMAGREVYGVENSDERIFRNANYIVVPTEKNTPEAIELCKELGREIGFGRISVLSPEQHDEMIAFVSQLTHCIAVSLMTCSDNTHLVDYTGDSFRDLTRIARINENMWCELFMLNREALLAQLDRFNGEISGFRELLAQGDEVGMKEKMRLSTERRALFDVK